MSSAPCEECGEWVYANLHHECAPEYQLEREQKLSADLASRLKQAQSALAIAELARDKWKQIATDMREERDHARLMLEKVGQMMGGME